MLRLLDGQPVVDRVLLLQLGASPSLRACSAHTVPAKRRYRTISIVSLSAIVAASTWSLIPVVSIAQFLRPQAVVKMLVVAVTVPYETDLAHLILFLLLLIVVVYIVDHHAADLGLIRLDAVADGPRETKASVHLLGRPGSLFLVQIVVVVADEARVDPLPELDVGVGGDGDGGRLSLDDGRVRHARVLHLLVVHRGVQPSKNKKFMSLYNFKCFLSTSIKTLNQISQKDYSINLKDATQSPQDSNLHFNTFNIIIIPYTNRHKIVHMQQKEAKEDFLHGLYACSFIFL